MGLKRGFENKMNNEDACYFQKTEAENRIIQASALIIERVLHPSEEPTQEAEVYDVMEQVVVISGAFSEEEDIV